MISLTRKNGTFVTLRPSDTVGADDNALDNLKLPAIIISSSLFLGLILAKYAEYSTRRLEHKFPFVEYNPTTGQVKMTKNRIVLELDKGPIL